MRPETEVDIEDDSETEKGVKSSMLVEPETDGVEAKERS